MANLTLPNPPLYQQPNEDVPESEKNKDWWIANVRWLTTFYDRPYQIWNQNDYMENLSPVQKGIQYSLYYTGKQRNINYNHITTDTDGNTLQAVWIKSKKAKNLIDRLAGIFIKQLENKDISARSLSERAITEKMNTWQDVMLQYDSQALKIFDELAEMGIEYNPPFGKKFDTKEQAEQWLTYSFKDDLEVAATEIGKYVEYSNDSDTLYLEAFKQDYAPANFMGVYNFVENGRVKQRKIPFYNLIWDITSDDPFVRDGRFCGFIERLTPQLIFKRYPKLSKEEKDEIKEIAKGGEIYDSISRIYNTSNMTWYQNRSGETVITCVTMFWNGERDTEYVKKDHPKGGYNFLEKDAKNSKGDYKIQDIHKAVLLGNKFLLEHGYDENVVRSINEKETPELPIKVMTGNTTMGDGISIIGTIAQLIDDMDAFDFKIRDLMGRNVGRTYVINGNKLGLGVKPKEMLQDLKTMGIHVSDGTTGEPGDPTNNQPMVYPMDFGLDDAIIHYSNLWRTLEMRVEELLSLPKIAQGTQQEVVGLGVQRGVIQQSLTGNANLFRNLFKFNEICLQYCVNLGKLIYAKGEGDETAPFVVGDRGMKALKLIKDRLFEDCLIIVSPKDMIDEQQKTQLLTIAQAMAQNDQIDILSFIAMQKNNTYSELENQLEFSIKKREQAKQQEFAQQQQALMQQEQQRQAGIQANIAAQEAGAMEKKKVESIKSIGVQEIKNEGAKELEAIKQQQTQK